MTKIDDKNIADFVEEAIKESMYKSAHDIKIQAMDGNVVLMGFVDTLGEKIEAGRLASTTPGVKSVENRITISTDGSFSDKEAEAEVLSKLSNVPEVEGIGVHVEKGVAVLEGRVNNLKKRNLAIQEASKAMGIKDIVSNIKITSVGQVDDATIHNNIQSAFRESHLQDCHIASKVNNGIVNLLGYINNIHDMEAAMEIAEGIEGVEKVNNMLKFREKKGL